MFDLTSVFPAQAAVDGHRVARAIATINIELPFDDPNLTQIPPNYLIVTFVGVTAVVLAALYFWKRGSGAD